MNPTAPEYVSPLLDVTGLTMDDLENLPDNVFACVIEEVRNPSSEPCAAFQSALG